MPGNRSGLDVARLIRLRHPALPIIYTTGRPDLLDTSSFGPQEMLVVKPYTPTEIMVVVRRLLAAPHN